jgi:histidine triad (HIT) family protein
MVNVTSCIFCNIKKNKYIYETKNFFVIKDINSVNDWHCLIITKEHIENMFFIKKKIFCEFDEIKDFLINKYKKEYWFEWFNLLHASWKIAQQSVNHFHIHFVPRYKNDWLDLWFNNK